MRDLQVGSIDRTSEVKRELLVVELLCVQFNIAGGMDRLDKEGARLSMEVFEASFINKLFSKLVYAVDYSLDHDAANDLVRSLVKRFNY
jgi:hypothetical protein